MVNKYMVYGREVAKIKTLQHVVYGKILMFRRAFGLYKTKPHHAPKPRTKRRPAMTAKCSPSLGLLRLFGWESNCFQVCSFVA